MADTAYEKGKLYHLQLTRLGPAPKPQQPHPEPESPSLAGLQASISSLGVLQPILVRVNADHSFCIISGERRFLAARLAGHSTIPAIITGGEAAEIVLIENIVQEKLTAIEEAEAIERLRTEHAYGLSELATVLGKTDAAIAELLSLNRLPNAVKDDCRHEPKASRKILAIIAREQTDERMLVMYGKYQENGLTRQETGRQPARAKQPGAPLAAADIAAFCTKLELLGTCRPGSEEQAAVSRELLRLRRLLKERLILGS